MSSSPNYTNDHEASQTSTHVIGLWKIITDLYYYPDTVLPIRVVGLCNHVATVNIPLKWRQVL